ncbi:hypothetical protein J502_0732 [Acinetobacter sp. 1294596]|uniref:Uncharacterized protein n=1 Tax=Acinetobacter radioresistens SK82 TaxID=596318 RepID=A0ABM9YN86_ACIRA|nr:hypothetical protein ACIRA0001_2807 [Acinetobacter radioresistens SK82]EXB86537.1 hypothetical protein J538_1382 [Acinetobacter sp. 272263]EXE60851.1 hypothetical protein J579_0173 [Acinetobacter sp. 1239920]EXF58041.1 hypothetical protein J502_0732 [Acinetobacter sp. 1294596]
MKRFKQSRLPESACRFLPAFFIVYFYKKELPILETFMM